MKRNCFKLTYIPWTELSSWCLKGGGMVCNYVLQKYGASVFEENKSWHALGGKEDCSKGCNTVRDLTLECEKLGYDSIRSGDHLTKSVYRLEYWTTLSASSTLTKSIRLETLVLCVGED